MPATIVARSALASDQPMNRGISFPMAVAAGVAAANLYYNQPMLGIIAREFSATDAVSLIPTATLLGYCRRLAAELE